MDEQKPQFLMLNRREQKAVIEALLFSSEEPQPLKDIYKLLVDSSSGFGEDSSAISDGNVNGGEDGSQISLGDVVQEKFNYRQDDIIALIDEINTELLETNRPFQIVKLAGGYLYVTRPEYGMLLQQLVKSKTKKRLSHAALEALAVIAYKQPVTKPEIEQVRGVNSGDVVNTLIEKGFVQIVGRKDALGKPLLYATTEEFLKIFGLNSLEELPKLREIEDIRTEPELHEDTFEIVVDKSLEETFIELPEAMKESLDYEAEENGSPQKF
jgi:segregation and condensation protein B